MRVRMKKKDKQTVRGCATVRERHKAIHRENKKTRERYSETMMNVQGSHLEAGALVMGVAGAE